MEPASDLAATVERLQRRLERERRARLESEAIAETGLRELYARQQQLQLLGVIATAANQNSSVAAALALALEEVCKFVGWNLAHALVRDEVAPRLIPTGIWYAEDAASYRPFRDATAGILIEAGRGLPGRVLTTGQPAWIADVTLDGNFMRKKMARRAGLRGAFAFPVMVGDEVAAVLEFFSVDPQEPREDVLDVMRQVGTQLGRIIERRRSQDQLLANNIELKRIAAEADAQRRAAEAANRAKSDFLAVTSHEVRTPLNAVLGLTEALKRESLSERQRELVEGVLDGGAMLLRLLNAVLDLSKIEAGKMIARSEPFDPRRMAEVVVRVWRPRSEELGVGLELDLSGLPPECCIVGDEAKLEQTLVNLISNAVKFSPAGGTVRVEMSGVRTSAGWRLGIEVVDQGPGVDPADRERIFRPFEQGELGRECGGTGLGLAICAGNLALMGGRIAVTAAEGGGAAFCIELDAMAGQLKVEAPPAAPAADPRLERPLRVLAAEDHPANRMVLKALLEPVGVALTLVGDGQAAVAAVAEGDYDLVLMDVNMPVMDGVSAVTAIRSSGGAAAAWPIYMLTANAFEDDVRRYVAAGADGVLKKPIDVGELFGLLENVAAVVSEAA